MIDSIPKYSDWTPEFIPKWLEKYEFVWYMQLLKSELLGKRSFSDPKKLTFVFFQVVGDSTLCINFQRYVSFLFTWLAMWAHFLIKKYLDNYGWKIQLIVYMVGDVIQLAYSKIFRQLLLKNITTWLAMWACSCFLLVYCTFANLRISAFKKLERW